MPRRLLLAGLLLPVLAAPAPAAAGDVALDPSGRIALPGAEISAYDAKSRRAYVTDAASNALHVVDLHAPETPALIRTIDLSPYGAGPNSVAVSPAFGGLVAVAVEADPKTAPGAVVLLDRDGHQRAETIPAGSLPDMLTFTPDGRTLLVANEGEPNDAYTVDPGGSVTVIDFDRGLGNPRVRSAGFGGVPVEGPVRVFGPGATVAQDLEPEYIATDGERAWVTLQENNAIGLLDVTNARFDLVRAMELKDHGQAGDGLDPNDRDGISISPFANVLGMPQPDAIAAYRAGGDDDVLLVTANEGDARDYAGFREEARVSTLDLDPTAFPSGPSALRRLTVTTTMGDTDGDGDFDRVHPFGARSMSILDAEARPVFDTGDELERIAAQRDAGNFNTSNTLGSPVDDRSDNKGPEPEGVAVGRVGGSTYAFLAAERSGGIYAYDLSAEPGRALLAGYVNLRAADLGPEGVAFVPDAGEGPLVLLTNEISGTLSVLRPRPES